MEKWLERRDDLLAGRTPQVSGDGLAAQDLCNRYLSAKERLLNAHELSQRSFDDYYATCERIIGTFGKSPIYIVHERRFVERFDVFAEFPHRRLVNVHHVTAFVAAEGDVLLQFGWTAAFGLTNMSPVITMPLIRWVLIENSARRHWLPKSHGSTSSKA